MFRSYSVNLRCLWEIRLKGFVWLVVRVIALLRRFRELGVRKGWVGFRFWRRRFCMWLEVKRGERMFVLKDS